MKNVKLLSLVLLAVYLFFNAAFSMFGYTPSGIISFFLGLAALGSGVLILISIREFLHFAE